MLHSGIDAFRNLLLFRYRLLRPVFNFLWNRTKPDIIEGISVDDAREIKKNVPVPVLCTGGFQTASVIREAITAGDCDAVTIARPLIANNDLVELFRAELDRAPRPCTYCNKCLVNVIENSLGCYEESRFASRDEMLAQIMSVFAQTPPTADANSLATN
jgi:2,4-dienoyl-CoA reductase (NADPH2)